MPEFLRLEMRGRQVRTGVWQEPRRRYWRPNAVSGKIGHIMHKEYNKFVEDVYF